MNTSKSFYNLETLGGALLFASALCAILIANSRYSDLYHQLLNLQARVSVAQHVMQKPLHVWVNDALMVLYFLLIGLEMKREVHRGVLSQRATLMVPATTALCGLLVPACIFTLCNLKHSLYLQGWAIPTATDIAFTLGIVSLLGARVPFSLKILLTAIAIFDDIAAIVMIACFYTTTLSGVALLIAGVAILILIGLNYYKCRYISVFMGVGFILWFAVLQSGVHATLAGILLAMTIPDQEEQSMLARLEKGLHPWVVFLILPIFAFMNAGVTFIGLSLSALMHPILLGVALGLFIGKQIGIFLPLAYFYHYTQLLHPAIRVRQLYGIALICGIGFTMSLLIGSLAYPQDEALMPLVKMGVLLGSVFSGLLGGMVLRGSRGAVKCS